MYLVTVTHRFRWGIYKSLPSRSKENQTW